MKYYFLAFLGMLMCVVGFFGGIMFAAFFISTEKIPIFSCAIIFGVISGSLAVIVGRKLAKLL
mgnify:CR=1 FL=1